MKIVIDIPNDVYSRIKRLVSLDYFEFDTYGYILREIADGTPLTKEQCKVIGVFDKEEEKER